MRPPQTSNDSPLVSSWPKAWHSRLVGGGAGRKATWASRQRKTAGGMYVREQDSAVACFRKKWPKMLRYPKRALQDELIRFPRLRLFKLLTRQLC